MKLVELYEATKKVATKSNTKEPDIARKALVELIKKVCPKNFELMATGKAVRLYRGTAHVGLQSAYGFDYIYVAGRTEPRVSQTGANIIIDYTAQAPDWKSVPSRNLSSSCTTEKEIARSFGKNSFLVIPADSVSAFAFMPTDFNETHIGDDDLDALTLLSQISVFMASAKKLAGELEYEDAEWYTDELKAILSNPIVNVNLKSTLSLDDIKAISTFIEQSVAFAESTVGQPNYQDLYYNKFIASANEVSDCLGQRTLMSFLKKYVTPKAMEVSVVKSYQEVKPKGHEPEVWFKGPFVAIKSSTNDDLEDVAGILKNLLPEVKA